MMFKKNDLKPIWRRKNLWTMFYIVLLMSISLVSAAPPFQTSTTTSGLEIAGVDFSAIKTMTHRTAVANVYNATSGMPITTTSVSCQFQVFSVADTGSLIFTNSTPTQIGNTFYFGIPNSIYNQSSEYTRIIQCNTSNVGGFYKSTFQANAEGRVEASGIVIVLFVLLTIILFAFLTYMLIYTIGHLVSLDFDVIDVAINYGAFFGLFVFNYFQNYYLGNPTLSNILQWVVDITVYTNMVLPLLALIISLVVGSIARKKMKSMSDMGMSQVGRR